MKRLRLIGAAALLACASSAFASSFVVTTDTLVRATGMTSNATSDTTNSFRDDKIILEARDDAASFVASQGDIRGSHLEAALRHIRGKLPSLAANDMQLAQAILTIREISFSCPAATRSSAAAEASSPPGRRSIRSIAAAKPASDALTSERPFSACKNICCKASICSAI